MYTRFRIILLVLLLLHLATSCSKSTPRPLHCRLVLDRIPNTNHIPLYVGTSLGYFTDEGIYLDIIKPSKEEPLYFLEEGSAEFVLTNLPRIFRMVAQHHDVKVIGKLIEKPLKGFLTLQSSGIKSIEDFNGRVLGYNSGHIRWPLAKVLLDEKNIQVGCQLNAGSDVINELVSGKIDIAYGVYYTYEGAYLEALGHKSRFFLVTDFGIPEHEEVIVATSGRMQKNAKTVAAFQRALKKSIEFCRSNPQLALEMFRNLRLSLPPKMAVSEEKSWYATLPLFAHSQEFSCENVKKLSDWLYETGFVGTRIDNPCDLMLQL